MTNREKMIEMLQQHKDKEFYYNFISINSNFKKRTMMFTLTVDAYPLILEEEFVPDDEINELLD